MFERFTDRARKVMALANQEAQRFNHEYIGTEHILLGLVKEGSGVGATVLKNLDIDLRKVRLEVEKLVKSGPDMVTMGALTIISNIYGNPAVSIPAGTIDGLPIGMQVLGKHHQDALLFDVALTVERERPWPMVAPPVAAVNSVH